MWKAFMYPKALANLFGGTSAGDAYQMDWLSDTIKIAGLKSAYTPSDTDEVYADVSSHEISSTIDATNHPAGGQTVGSKTVTYSGGVVHAAGSGLGLHRNNFDINDTHDIRWAVVYDDSVTDDPLLGYVDFNKLIGHEGPTDFLPLNALATGLDFTFASPSTGQCRWFGKAMANALGGETSGESRATDYLSDIIKVALMTETYAPNLDTDEQFSSISANEVSGTGYTAGGVALGSKTLALSSKTLSFGAADPTWTLTATAARWGVAYNDTNADKPLLWLYDLFGPHSPASEAMNVHFAGGIAATLKCV